MCRSEEADERARVEEESAPRVGGKDFERGGNDRYAPPVERFDGDAAAKAPAPALGHARRGEVGDARLPRREPKRLAPPGVARAAIEDNIRAARPPRQTVGQAHV